MRIYFSYINSNQYVGESYANLIISSLSFNVAFVELRKDIFIKLNKKMIKFVISAPGRIFLSGEHTATLGKHFVMAGLNLRTQLQFWELPDEQTNIRIDLLDYKKNIPLQDVQHLFSQLNVRNLLRSINNFINGMWIKRKDQLKLQIFFYLLYTIVYDMKHEMKPFCLCVSTEIPFQNGLGGSTSFVVCLAACFLHWKRLQSGDHIRFNDQDLQEIEVYTRFCENMVQWNKFVPIDAKVCVYGNIYRCKYNNNDQTCTISRTIDLTTELKILLIETHCRLTKAQRNEQMEDLMSSRLSNSNSILNELDEIAINIFDDLNHINNNIEDPDAYNGLQRDIKRNQQILSRNNLSHFEFDIITCLGSKFNLTGKLTGFQGSYVYFPLPPKIAKKEITRITNLFSYRKCNYKIATIGCDGVRIDN